MSLHLVRLLSRVAALLVMLAAVLSPRTAAADDGGEHEYDVVVYGGTAAGVTAAIAADRMGKSVALVCPDTHIGGMTVSGLGWTDSKNGNAVGGLSREFYHRVWQYYRDPAVWKQSTRDGYKDNGSQPGNPAMNDQQQVMWTFEPHAAEKVIDAWLDDSGVEVYRDHWLDRDSGVVVEDGTIRQIKMIDGTAFSAKVFIDAGYEGDLMAAAGVSHDIGRDARSDYDEALNGIRFEIKGVDRYYHGDAFIGISPYVRPGVPGSGFLPGVEGMMPEDEQLGDADDRLQSFNFRLCLTAQPNNRVQIEKPADYDEAEYELLLRLFDAGHPSSFTDQEMPNYKTDSNNRGVVSFDYVGGNFNEDEGWNYSEASYDKRREIYEDHKRYQMGLLWTLANNPRIPADQRQRNGRYGLAKDEFVDNDNWPDQMYVREARRLKGEFTMTAHHVRLNEEVPKPIGLGSYSLDSHVVRRVVVDDTIVAEGGFYEFWDKPYPIGYGSLVPRRDEMTNLLVPVTLSASHAAFGSIRMEPTYMILGHTSGVAAALAIDKDAAVQNLDYDALARTLREQGQLLVPSDMK